MQEGGFEGFQVGGTRTARGTGVGKWGRSKLANLEPAAGKPRGGQPRQVRLARLQFHTATVKGLEFGSKSHRTCNTCSGKPPVTTMEPGTRKQWTATGISRRQMSLSHRHTPLTTRMPFRCPSLPLPPLALSSPRDAGLSAACQFHLRFPISGCALRLRQGPFAMSSEQLPMATPGQGLVGIYPRFKETVKEPLSYAPAQANRTASAVFRSPLASAPNL
jgi:hypothetical protein